MNKQKGIIIGILALIVTMMVGYAIFSETITINGTATAKGEFSFEISTQKEVADAVKTNSMYAILNNFDVTGDAIQYGVSSSGIESAITNTSNTVTYSAAFTNPGQKQYFTVKVTNTGTIPINIDIYNNFVNDTSITGNLIMDDGNMFDITKIKDATLGASNEYGFTSSDLITSELLKANLVNLYEILVPKKVYDDLNSNFETDPNATPKLETGESLYLVFYSYWRPDISLNSRVVGFDVSATNTITIPVKQVTN